MSMTGLARRLTGLSLTNESSKTFRESRDRRGRDSFPWDARALGGLSANAIHVPLKIGENWSQRQKWEECQHHQNDNTPDQHQGED
jgi:hypothetical protein